MISPEIVAERIVPPEGVERRHVLVGAHLVLAEGLAPRDGTVLDRARRLARAETPAAREAWRQVHKGLFELARLPEATVQMWLNPFAVYERGDVLVLLMPVRTADWSRRRYGGMLSDLVCRVSAFQMVDIQSFGVRPAGRNGGVR